MIEFKLTDEQEQEYDNWHNHCDFDAGAIGGRISFVFTPTGLGECVVVKCLCGEEINLTDSNNW